MRETSRLLILISAYEGGVGHVYSQSRGRGQRKIFWGGAPDPDVFCLPPNKNSWRRHCIEMMLQRKEKKVDIYDEELKDLKGTFSLRSEVNGIDRKGFTYFTKPSL